MNDLPILLLIFGPAVVAIGCIVLAIVLAKQGGQDERGVGALRIFAIVVLALVAFGIGSCYAAMFLGGLNGL